MPENNYQTAKQFWTDRDQYPPYDYVEARRLCDIKYIVPRVESARSLLDLGCGDGRISLVLSYLTRILKFTLVDFSEHLVDREAISKFDFQCADLSQVRNLPKADVVVCLGLFPYIFNDEDLSGLLGSLNTRGLIVRTPCALNSHNETINKYSEALDAQYAAVYRTLKNTVAIIEPHFTITEVERIYPDKIESKFNTKQFILKCQPSLDILP